MNKFNNTLHSTLSYFDNEIDIESLESMASLADAATDNISASLVQDSGAAVDVIALDNHTADPIKDPADISKICHYLKDSGCYRDYLYFIVGINSGLRCSDILRLQFGHIIEKDPATGAFRFKTTFPILEQKTKRKGHNRQVTINQAVKDAVIYYMKCFKAEHHRSVDLSDYLFTAYATRGNQNKSDHLSRKTADRIMKRIKKECGLKGQISTHTLRKTFGYQFLQRNHYSNKALVLLQVIFGHSDMSDTLRYIGITSDEIANAYLQNAIGLEEDTVNSDMKYTSEGLGNVSMADAGNNTFQFYA